jgi:hypothetical protein
MPANLAEMNVQELNDLMTNIQSEIRNRNNLQELKNSSFQELKDSGKLQLFIQKFEKLNKQFSDVNNSKIDFEFLFPVKCTATISVYVNDLNKFNNNTQLLVDNLFDVSISAKLVETEGLTSKQHEICEELLEDMIRYRTFRIEDALPDLWKELTALLDEIKQFKNEIAEVGLSLKDFQNKL